MEESEYSRVYFCVLTLKLRFPVGLLTDVRETNNIFKPITCKPPTVGEQYFRQKKCLLLYIYYTFRKKMSQQEK